MTKQSNKKMLTDGQVDAVRGMRSLLDELNVFDFELKMIMEKVKPDRHDIAGSSYKILSYISTCQKLSFMMVEASDILNSCEKSIKKL